MLRGLRGQGRMVARHPDLHPRGMRDRVSGVYRPPGRPEPEVHPVVPVLLPGLATGDDGQGQELLITVRGFFILLHFFALIAFISINST